MAALSQLDDNMIPGQTYTFQLKLSNWITSPSTPVLQQDLIGYAPEFVGNNLQVTIADTLWVLNDTFNIQFTYNGDGTDVISDVASQLIAAIKQGSNDDFSFVGAVADTAASTNTGVLQNAADSVGDAINKALGGATKSVADSAQNLLTPIEVAVGILALIVVVVIFTAGKSGGVSLSEFGASVGGSK